MTNRDVLLPMLGPMATLTDYMLAAANELLRAVDAAHDKQPPLKYTIPYGAVNTLRDAVTKYEANPPTQGAHVTLSGQALKDALEFVAPDMDADQLETEVYIQYGDGHSGRGYYCSLAEYPNEGAILLGTEPPSGGG